MINLTRKRKSTNTKKRGILRLLSAPGRHIKRKVKIIYRKLVKKEPKKTAKTPNILENEGNSVEKLQRKSIDELKKIARLRRTKNKDKSAKEGLIISFLKSESSNAERNYMKHFINNTNDGNNTNDDNNNDDDTYDGKINDIRMILSRSGNMLTSNDRKKIKKELYEIEHKENLSEAEKEENYEYLRKLVRILNNKEKYKYRNHNDLDYHGIRDIESLVDDVNNNDYYKPTLVKSSFNENYKYYKSRGDKDKKLSVMQYLHKIIPYLRDIINDRKTNSNNSNEWKIQLNMPVNFISSNDTAEIRTIFVWSNNEEIRLGNETDDIIKGLINSFLNNYQKEEIILRNGSNFVFESIDLLSYHIHKISLKKGNSYIKSPEWLKSKRATINVKKNR